MPIQFVPYTEAHTVAANAFNSRINHNGDAPFLLPEKPLPPPGDQIRSTQFVAADGEEVRGGYLLVQYPALMNGASLDVVNIQSPLAESIVDSRFSMMPLQMVKQFLTHNPHCFVVGMGDQGNPLPRLLRASGWSVESAPFYFRVHRAARFLTGMPMLQSPWWKRTGALLAAYSGAGAMGAMLVQRRTAQVPSGVTVRLESEWGDWADEVWPQFAPAFAFGVRRQLAVLRELYPAGSTRMRIHRVCQGARTLGWSVSLLTPMRNNAYFGNLLVASVLDCAALPGCFDTVAVLTDRALGKEGADLVITNQTLSAWKSAFTAAGFHTGPSRFQVAMSPALTRILSKTPLASGTIHITRGDGDGRLNL